ncbi:hypothetical protein ACIGBH_17455 [Streptomyces sp. NPDC085929]
MEEIVMSAAASLLGAMATAAFLTARVSGQGRAYLAGRDITIRER